MKADLSSSILTVPQRSKAYPSPPDTPQGVKLSDITAHFTGLTRDHRGEWRFYLIEPSDPMQARSSEGRPFMLYLHGGAYVATAQSAHFELVYDVCQRTGATILLPAYPRPPTDNVTHRDVIEPLVQLCGKLRASAAAPSATVGDDDEASRIYALARSARNFTISGDSAGGGLALALTMLLLREAKQNLLPDTLILNAPWLDVSLTDAEIAGHYDRLVSSVWSRGVSVAAECIKPTSLPTSTSRCHGAHRIPGYVCL